MSPDDLKAIYGSLKDLKQSVYGGKGKRPFIFQEVIDLSTGEAVSKSEYTGLGAVIEFMFGNVLGRVFRGWEDSLGSLEQWGTSSDSHKLLSSGDALVMIDNHDNQRGHGAGGNAILTYKDPKLYKVRV